MTWNQRVKRAVKAGSFIPIDIKLAGAFTTCAVGERLGLTSDWRGKVPHDLETLGYSFYFAVRGNDPEAAHRFLKEITAYPVRTPTV